MYRKSIAPIICIVISLFTYQTYAKTYLIDKMIDLNGKTLSLSKTDVLIFEQNGQLINGFVYGDNACIKAPKKEVFRDVVLKGEFKSEVAYSEWFGAKADCVLNNKKVFVSGTDNTKALAYLLLFDKVEIAPGQYMVRGELKCRGNQSINGNGAIIKCLNKGACLCIDGKSSIPISNVAIRNITIIGGKNDFNDKTEFWDGIDIGFARNIILENVNTEYCRGDGFYIGTSIGNIKDNRMPIGICLLNVKAYHNHRQGLSITRAKGVLIKNSEFCYTQGTPPQRGIDIEPNCKRCDDGSWNVGTCEDIVIDNCMFKGNAVAGIVLFKVPDDINQNKYILKNITIKNSIFEDDDIYIEGGKNIKLENLTLHNSIIGIVERSAVKNLTISHITMHESRWINGRNAIELDYAKNGALKKNIQINDVTIRGYGGAGIIVRSGDREDIQYNKVVISNCTITNCGKGIVIGNNVKNLKDINNIVVSKKLISYLLGGGVLILGFAGFTGKRIINGKYLD